MEDTSAKVSETGIQGSIGFKRADGSPLPISLEKLNINFESGKIISGSVEVNEAIKFTLPLAGEVTVNKKPGQKEPVILIDKRGLTVEGVGTAESGLFQCEFNSLLFDINLLKETPPAILSGNVKIKPEETSAVLLSAGSDGSINWKLVSALAAADVTNLLEIRFALKEAITIDSQGAHLPKDPAIKAFMESSVLNPISLEKDDAFLLSPSFNDGKLKLTAGSARFKYGGTAFAVYDKDGLRLTKDAAFAALPDELYLPKKETAYLKLKDKNKLLVRIEKKEDGFYIWTEGENTIELYVPALMLKEPIKISIHEDKKLLVKTASDNSLELLEGTIDVDAGQLTPVTRASSDEKTSLEVKIVRLKIEKEKEKPLSLTFPDAAATVSSPLFKDDSGNTVKLTSGVTLTMDTTGAITGVLKEIDLTKTKPLEVIFDSAFKLSFTKADIKIRLSLSREKEEESSASWLTADLSGSTLEKPFSGLEVDLTSGKITAGKILLEQAVLYLPFFGYTKVEKVELTAKGLNLSGQGKYNEWVKVGYRLQIEFFDLLLQVNLLDTYQTGVVSGSALLNDESFFDIIQEYEDGPITHYGMEPEDRILYESSFLDALLAISRGPTLDKDGLHITCDGKASVSYRFGELKFENLSAKCSEDFAIDIFNVVKSTAGFIDGKFQTIALYSEFLSKIKSGSADFSLKQASVATLDKEGFKPDASMLFVSFPAELPLPSKDVMFMPIKDASGKPLVKYEAIEGKTIKIWTSSPATLTIPALLSKGKPVTLPLSIPEGDAILVNVKDLKVSGGVISAAPASPISFDYENIPFKLTGVKYDMESQQTKIDGSFELVLGEGASGKTAAFHFKEFVVSQYGLSGEVDISDETALPAFEFSQVKLMLAGGKIVFHAGEMDAKATYQEMANQLNTQKKEIQTELEELEKKEKEFKGKLEKVTDITTIKQKIQEVEDSLKELEKNKPAYEKNLKGIAATLDAKRAALDSAKQSWAENSYYIKFYSARVESLKKELKKNLTPGKRAEVADSLDTAEKSIILWTTPQYLQAEQEIVKLNKEILANENAEKVIRANLSDAVKKIEDNGMEKLALEGSLVEAQKPVTAREMSQKMLDSISAGVVSLKEEIKAIDSKIQEAENLSKSGEKAVIKQISFLELSGKVLSLPMGGELSTPVAFQGLSAAIEKGKVKFSGAFSAGATPEAQTWYHRRKEKLFARSEVVLGVFADGGNEPPVATLSLWNGKLALSVYYVSMLFRDNQLRLANFDAGVKYGLSGVILETTMHLGLIGKDILYGKAVLADKTEPLEWNNLELDFDKGNIEAAVSLSDPAKTQALFYDVKGRVNKLWWMAVDADRVSFAFSITENGVSGTVNTSLSSDNTAKPLFTGKGLEDKLSFKLNAVQFEFKDDKETSSTALGGFVWKIDNGEYPLQVAAFKEGEFTADIKESDALPIISVRLGTDVRLTEGKVKLNTEGEFELTDLKGKFVKIAAQNLNYPISFKNASWNEKGFSGRIFSGRRKTKMGVGAASLVSMRFQHNYDMNFKVYEVEADIKNSTILQSSPFINTKGITDKLHGISGILTIGGFGGDAFTQDFSLELFTDDLKDKLEGKTTIRFPSDSSINSRGVIYHVDEGELSVSYFVDKGHVWDGYTPQLTGDVELGKLKGSLQSIPPIGAFSPAISFEDITDLALTGDGLFGSKEFSTPFETQVKLLEYAMEYEYGQWRKKETSQLSRKKETHEYSMPVKLFINKLEMYGGQIRVVGEMTMERKNMSYRANTIDLVPKECSSATASVDFKTNANETIIHPDNDIIFLFCKGEDNETIIRASKDEGISLLYQPTLFVRFPSINTVFLEIRGEKVTNPENSTVNGNKITFTGKDVRAFLHLPFLGDALFTREENIHAGLKAAEGSLYYKYPMSVVDIGSLKVNCTWDATKKLGTDCAVKSITNASGSASGAYTKSNYTLNISKITFAYNGPSSVTECELKDSPYLEIEGSITVPVLGGPTNFDKLYVDKNGVCGSFSAKDMPQGYYVKSNAIEVKSAKIIIKKGIARIDEMSGNITINFDGKAVTVPFPKWDVSFPGAKEKKNYIASWDDYYIGTLAETNVKLTVGGDTDLVKSVTVTKIKVELQPGDAPSVSFVAEADKIGGPQIKIGGDSSVKGTLSYGPRGETNVKLTQNPTPADLEILIGKVARIKAKSGVMEVDDEKKSYMRLKDAKMTILPFSVVSGGTYDVGDRIKVYSDHVEVDNSMGALSAEGNLRVFIGSLSMDKFDFGKDATKGDYFTSTGKFKAQFAGIAELSGGIDVLGTYKLFGDGTEEIGNFFLNGVGPGFLLGGSFTWADIDNKEEIPIYKIDTTICPSTTLENTTVQDTDDKIDIIADVDVNVLGIALAGRAVALSNKTFGFYVELNSGIEVPFIFTPTLPPVPVVSLKGVAGGLLVSGTGVYSGALGATLGFYKLDSLVFPAYLIFTYKKKTLMGSLCGGFVYNLEWDKVNPVCKGGLALDLQYDLKEKEVSFKGAAKAVCKFPPSTGSVIDGSVDVTACLSSGDEFCAKKLSDYGNLKECVADEKVEKVNYILSFNGSATLLKDTPFKQSMTLNGIVDTTYGFHLYGAANLNMDIDLAVVKAYAKLDASCLLCKMGRSGFWGEIKGSGKAGVSVLGIGASLNVKGKLGLKTSPKVIFSGQIAGGACLGAGCESGVCDSCIDTCCPNNPCQMESTACGKKGSCIDASFWSFRGVGAGCVDFSLPSN